MARRRIKKARISHISLVPKGMNKMPVIYKSADDSIDLQFLVKAPDTFDEKGELLAVIYAPETIDGEGDIASAEVIKEAMHDFAKNGQGVDMRHDLKVLSKDQAFVAESFEIQKSDPRFTDFKDYDDKPVDVTGGWGVVIKIDDPTLRKQYREGKWNGVSMFGSAMVEKEDSTADKVIASLAKHLGLNNSTTNNGDLDMDAKELNALLAENNKTLIKGISEAATEIAKSLTGKTDPPAPKPAADVTAAKPSEVPVFKGEPTPENLKKHRIALKRHAILSKIDWVDDASVSAAETALADLAKEEGTVKKSSDPTEAEIAKLQAQIASLRKGSNQTVADDNTEPAPTEDAAISKETVELVKLGKEMAERSNRRRGLVK